MKRMMLMIVMLSIIVFAGKITLLNRRAIDIVYHVPLNKFPRFICEAKLENGKIIQFASVKSMMQAYFHQAYFLQKKIIIAKIKDMYVQDFLTGFAVNAKKAVYVFGSNIRQPNGDNLVPFKDIKEAKLFEKRYGGAAILKFKRISLSLIELLDMGP